MELEFTLHPDDAGPLSRSKLLGGPKPTRPRQQSLRLTWHDSPERALRADDLALVEQRGAWRLERLTPGASDSLPTQPTEVLARSTSHATLGQPLPEALSPVAAFNGRQTTYVVPTPDGDVTLQLQRGSLRGVTASHAICRLCFNGPDDAVRAMALALADTFRLCVPRASLAAEAFAAADGWPIPPRRLGAPRRVEERTVTDAFAQVLGHLTDVLIYHAPKAAIGENDTEPVHQMRVATRRARSAIAVFSHALACPIVAAANRDLKVLGTVLGPARDWDVFVTETLPVISAAFPDDGRLRRLAAAAARQRADHHATLRAWLLSAQFRRLGIFLACLTASQSWHDTLEPAKREIAETPLPSFSAIVLQRRWKKLLAAGKDIHELGIPALHSLRLRAKRLRYAAEIFQPNAHNKQARRLLRRLGLLQERLGILNDGAVAANLLAHLGGPRGRHGYAVGLVLGFLAGGAANVRPPIIRAWEKIDRTPPFWA